MIKKYDYFCILLIFLSSFIANYYYGSVGVFPIDTFAFFDSANFINKGYLPIRDYWTSNGFLVDLLQSIFFKFFGVNWYAYLLHSSILNFIFSVFTYKFLKSEGLNLKFSLFYSLSVSLLLYPPVGVPFSDHHSIIFSLLSIYSLVAASRKNSALFLCLSIFLLGLAFLCKQIPAAFFIVSVTFYIIYQSIKNNNFYWIYISSIFSFAMILLCIFFLILNKIGIHNFLIQYIFFPISIGSDRSVGIDIKYLLLGFIKEFKFFSLLILLMAYQIKFEKLKLNKTHIIFLVVSIILILNQNLIKNQIIIIFLLPILIGIIHSKMSLNNKKKESIFIAFLFLLNIFITAKYHDRFNNERKFMDLQNINKSIYEDGFKISKKLKGLKWFTVNSKTNLKKETMFLNDSISYLKKNHRDSIIITHYQFINSEIDNKIYSPNRWYTNDGVSYPLKENKHYDYYVKFYKNKLIEKKITKIFTVYPLDAGSFNFILRNNCFETTKINQILLEHKLSNCFAKEK